MQLPTAAPDAEAGWVERAQKPVLLLVREIGGLVEGASVKVQT
jgi:hypothetical protein